MGKCCYRRKRCYYFGITPTLEPGAIQSCRRMAHGSCGHQQLTPTHGSLHQQWHSKVPPTTPTQCRVKYHPVRTRRCRWARCPFCERCAAAWPTVSTVGPHTTDRVVFTRAAVVTTPVVGVGACVRARARRACVCVVGHVKKIRAGLFSYSKNTVPCADFIFAAQALLWEFSSTS